MYLLVEKKTKMILLSSARPIDPTQYSLEENDIVEIPDDKYDPNMVGGILHE